MEEKNPLALSVLPSTAFLSCFLSELLEKRISTRWLQFLISCSTFNPWWSAFLLLPCLWSSAQIYWQLSSSKIYWTVLSLIFLDFSAASDSLSAILLIFLQRLWSLLFRLFWVYSSFVHLYMLITQKGSTDHMKLFSTWSDRASPQLPLVEEIELTNGKGLSITISHTEQTISMI